MVTGLSTAKIVVFYHYLKFDDEVINSFSKLVNMATGLSVTEIVVFYHYL